jgi:hypothetical protein
MLAENAITWFLFGPLVLGLGLVLPALVLGTIGWAWNTLVTKPVRRKRREREV